MPQLGLFQAGMVGAPPMFGKPGSDAKSVYPSVIRPLTPSEQATVVREVVPTSYLGSKETDTVSAAAGAGAAETRLRVARNAEVKAMVDFIFVEDLVVL